MDDATVRRFLRYYRNDIVDFSIDIARLDDNEIEAVNLCGRRRLTVEQAAEQSRIPCSVNTMQNRWHRARKRLCKAWSGIEWITMLANTVDE